jgi:hypothetical protein
MADVSPAATTTFFIITHRSADFARIYVTVEVPDR